MQQLLMLLRKMMMMMMMMMIVSVRLMDRLQSTPNNSGALTIPATSRTHTYSHRQTDRQTDRWSHSSV